MARILVAPLRVVLTAFTWNAGAVEADGGVGGAIDEVAWILGVGEAHAVEADGGVGGAIDEVA
jgi:hypothetical protein